jgi:hypothetical protein
VGLSLIPWAIAGIAALGGVGYFLHCEESKRDHANFISQQKAEADAQQRGNQQKAERDQRYKEQADEARKKDFDNFHAVIKRLRDDRARASSVPTAPANAPRPDLACFDRDEFARAVGNFEAGMESIAGKGAEATIEINSARGWALKLSTELSR